MCLWEKQEYILQEHVFCHCAIMLQSNTRNYYVRWICLFFTGWGKLITWLTAGWVSYLHISYEDAQILYSCSLYWDIESYLFILWLIQQIFKKSTLEQQFLSDKCWSLGWSLVHDCVDQSFSTSTFLITSSPGFIFSSLLIVLCPIGINWPFAKPRLLLLLHPAVRALLPWSPRCHYPHAPIKYQSGNINPRKRHAEGSTLCVWFRGENRFKRWRYEDEQTVKRPETLPLLSTGAAKVNAEQK